MTPLLLTLLRQPSTPEGTPGRLMHEGREVCRTLELPWNNNDPAGDGDDILSCIPTGEYRVTYLPASASGKYRDVYHVQGVPGRSAILIHPANFAGDLRFGWKSDLEGCIAPCLSFGKLANHRGRMQFAGIGSRQALHRLHAVTGRQSFTLRVQNDPSPG